MILRTQSVLNHVRQQHHFLEIHYTITEKVVVVLLDGEKVFSVHTKKRTGNVFSVRKNEISQVFHVSFQVKQSAQRLVFLPSFPILRAHFGPGLFEPRNIVSIERSDDRVTTVQIEDFLAF